MVGAGSERALMTSEYTSVPAPSVEKGTDMHEAKGSTISRMELRGPTPQRLVHALVGGRYTELVMMYWSALDVVERSLGIVPVRKPVEQASKRFAQ
jgi:hypothetical protein